MKAMTLQSQCPSKFGHEAHRWMLGATVYQCQGVMSMGYERAIQAVRQDERERVREYVLKRMGHCDDCAATEAWDEATTGGIYPYIGADPEDLCDCAYQTVEGLFDELREEDR